MIAINGCREEKGHALSLDKMKGIEVSEKGPLLPVASRFW